MRYSGATALAALIVALAGSPGLALRGSAGGAADEGALQADQDVALPPVERVSFGTAPGRADVVEGGVPSPSFASTSGPFTDLVPASPSARRTRVTVARSAAGADVCEPTVEAAGDGRGSTRVWYQCRGDGECAVEATLHTAPDPVRLAWRHACGGQASPGANVGSKETLADVARAGRASPEWDPANPLVTVPPEQSVSYLYLEPREGEGEVHARALHLAAEPADVVRFHSYGTLDRDARPFYRRSGVANLALFRPVNKSSHLCGHYGRRAVDGITVGDDRELYVAMTGLHGADPQPWLQVDLGDAGMAADVMEVHLWNRVDGGGAVTARNFPCWVMLFDSDAPPPADLDAARRLAVAETKLTRDKRLSTWRLAEPVRARWVRVQLERTTYLQLAELEVYGATGPARCPRPLPPGDRADPVCYRAAPGAAQHADLVYECLRPGETTVTATLPIYPEWGPHDPVRAAWRKRCTDERHPKLAVGTAPDASDVVRMGVTQPEFVPAEDPTAKWMGGRGVFEPSEEEEEEQTARAAARQAEDERDAAQNAQLASEEGAASAGEPAGGGAAAAAAAAADGPAETVHDALQAAGHLRRVPGAEVETVLYLRMTALGSAVDVGPPEVTLSPGAGDVMAPALFGRLSRGGAVTDQPKTLRLRYGCKRAGEGVVTVAFRTVPHLQPYGPVAFAFRKVCGGPRVDMDVFAAAREAAAVAAADDDDDAEDAPPPGPEDAPSVTQGGVPTSAYYTETLDAPHGPSAITPGVTGAAATGGASAPFAARLEAGGAAGRDAGADADADEELVPQGSSSSSSSGTATEGEGAPAAGAAAAASGARLVRVMRAAAAGGAEGQAEGDGEGDTMFNHKPGMMVGEDEGTSTFFLSVPASEQELAAGVETRQPVPCADDSSRNCTQVAADGGGVHAWCSPDICAAGGLGLGRGPAVSGEVVGSPGDRSSPSAKPSLELTYHCTGTGATVVTVQVYPSAFNDPVEFSFTKQCWAWSDTWWGVSILAVLGIGAVAGAGFGVYAAGLHKTVAKAVGLSGKQ